mgnify:CR=1 FL=1
MAGQRQVLFHTSALGQLRERMDTSPPTARNTRSLIEAARRDLYQREPQFQSGALHLKGQSGIFGQMKGIAFYLLVGVVGLMLLAGMGCDIVEAPYRTGTSRVEVRDSLRTDTIQLPVRQYVLLEDFTGFRCGNCPAAGDVLKALHEAHPEALIPLKVHVGPLATPTTRLPYEYRNQTGNDIDNRFNISGGGIPKGMVNRRDFGGSVVLTASNWPAALQAELQRPPKAMLRLHGLFDTEKSLMDVQIRYEALAQGDLNQRLAVYLVEDSLVSVQEDYRGGRGLIRPYVHNYTLRGSFNGAFGEELRQVLNARYRTPQDLIPAGTIDYVGFRQAANPDWRLGHVWVIALLLEPSGEVVQVAQARLLPATLD